MTWEERLITLGFKPIDTAPRDGTMIAVTAENEPVLLVSWNQFGSNDIAQPGQRGIWWGPNGAFTWSEKDGFGPTHWAKRDNPLVQGIYGPARAAEGLL